MIWRLILNSWDKRIHLVATLDSWANTEGKIIPLALAFQCCLSVSKTQNPNNEDGSVYGLTHPCLNPVVPFPKLCLHSLFWNAHLYTKTLPLFILHDVSVSLGSNNSMGYGINPHPIHLHIVLDTMTYWLLICGWVFLSRECLFLSHQTKFCKFRTLPFYLLHQLHLFEETPKYSHFTYIIQNTF